MKTLSEDIVYTLVSVEMFNTPGVILWAIRGMTRKEATKFLSLAFPHISKKAVVNLVNENYKVVMGEDGVGDSVVVEG